MKYKKFKKEKIRIKLSSSFLIKNICSYCHSPPTFYYRIENESIYKDYRKDLLKFNYIKNSCFRMCNDYYLEESPSKCKDVSMLKFPTAFKKYNPKLHYTRGLKNSNYTEYLVCKCGKRSWAFNYMSNSKRKEICQRQAAYFYPKIIKY